MLKTNEIVLHELNVTYLFDNCDITMQYQLDRFNSAKNDKM